MTYNVFNGTLSLYTIATLWLAKKPAINFLKPAIIQEKCGLGYGKNVFIC